MIRLTPAPLLEVAPWIGDGLDEEERGALAATLVVERVAVEPGPWIWDGRPLEVGLQIVAGRIARGLRVEDAGAHGIEILGEGDLLRPWTFRGPSASVPSTVDWTVMAPMECALLDHEFVAASTRSPRLMINVLDLAIERSRTFSYFLTARQVSRLEGRILLTLWHLADRWGRVSGEGVVLDLPRLTHEMIARMIAARRPSVTTGIRHLRELGLVETDHGGRWVLLGDPVAALGAIDTHPAPKLDTHPA